MGTASFLNRLVSSVRRNPWQLIRAIICSIFVSYTICWAILEPLIAFASDPKVFNGLPKYVVFVAASLVLGTVYFCWKHVPKTRVSFLLPNTNTRLTIGFGDFFDQPGHKLIPVNNFFDGQLGDIISPRSLHGQFIERFLGGQATAFYSLIDNSLANVPADADLVQRAQGRKKKYPIGTTAIGTVNGDKYFFVALTTTNPQTHKVSADVPELWQALHGLWCTVREYAGGHPVVMPLMGGGLAGVGLPDSVLLSLILTSIVNETKKNRITGEISVVMHPSVLEHVDLARLENDWS